MSSSKRQQTMAKMARERTVRERRELKLEKKQAAAAERKAKAAGTWFPPEPESYPTEAEELTDGNGELDRPPPA
jgi:hypothetical protein